MLGPRFITPYLPAISIIARSFAARGGVKRISIDQVFATSASILAKDSSPNSPVVDFAQESIVPRTCPQADAIRMIALKLKRMLDAVERRPPKKAFHQGG
jgi:hypothetical protein